MQYFLILVFVYHKNKKYIFWLYDKKLNMTQAFVVEY